MSGSEASQAACGWSGEPAMKRTERQLPIHSLLAESISTVAQCWWRLQCWFEVSCRHQSVNLAPDGCLALAVDQGANDGRRWERQRPWVRSATRGVTLSRKGVPASTSTRTAE